MGDVPGVGTPSALPLDARIQQQRTDTFDRIAEEAVAEMESGVAPDTAPRTWKGLDCGSSMAENPHAAPIDLPACRYLFEDAGVGKPAGSSGDGGTPKPETQDEALNRQKLFC